MNCLLLPLTTLLLALVLPACSLLDSGEGFVSEPGGLLQTDRTSYDARLLLDDRPRVVLEIPYQTRNPTSGSLYLIGCFVPSPPVLEKRVDGAWRTAYGAVVFMCLSPPVEIGPGEVRHDTLRVVGYLPGQNVAPTFDTEIAGTYRLRREIYAGLTDASSLEGGALLSLNQRISNTFEVR